MQAKNKSQGSQSALPYKSLLLSAAQSHQPQHLMTCGSTRGVGLLRGTPKHNAEVGIGQQAILEQPESKQLDYFTQLNVFQNLPTLISRGNDPFLSFNSLSSLFFEKFLSRNEHSQCKVHANLMTKQTYFIKQLIFLSPTILDIAFQENKSLQ